MARQGDIEGVALETTGYERKFTRDREGARAERSATGAIPESQVSSTALRRDTLYRRSLAASDAIAAIFSLALAIPVLSATDRLTAWAVLCVPLMVVIAKVIGLYDRDQHLIRKTTLEELPALFQVATLFTLAVWFGERILVVGALSKPQVFSLLIFSFVSLALGRELVRQVVKRRTAPERCLVLGDAESAERIRGKFDLSYSMRAELVGRVPLEPEPEPSRAGGVQLLGSIDTLGFTLELHEIQRLVIAPHAADSDEILDAIRVAKALGVKVSLLPRMLDVVGSSVEFDDVDGLTLLGLRGFGLSKSSKAVKRTMDIAGASIVIALMSPLLAWIALAVKLTSPGPVLFRQRRVGRDGKPFEMFKFRTMVDGADAQKDALAHRNEAADGLFKIADDPRFTRIGRFLRRASLDELPQLFNVLKGDMSLVGPRPLVVDEDARIQGWQRQRLNVSPGMTGYWQILGSSRVPRSEMVKIDYLYGANWSPWLDVKILLRTVPHVVARRGL